MLTSLSTSLSDLPTRRICAAHLTRVAHHTLSPSNHIHPRIALASGIGIITVMGDESLSSLVSPLVESRALFLSQSASSNHLSQRFFAYLVETMAEHVAMPPPRVAVAVFLPPRGAPKEEMDARRRTLAAVVAKRRQIVKSGLLMSRDNMSRDMTSRDIVSRAVDVETESSVLPEYWVPWMVHLLAGVAGKDAGKEMEEFDWARADRAVESFVEAVVNAENIAYVYNCAVSVKKYKDAVDPDRTEVRRRKFSV